MTVQLLDLVSARNPHKSPTELVNTISNVQSLHNSYKNLTPFGIAVEGFHIMSRINHALNAINITLQEYLSTESASTEC